MIPILHHRVDPSAGDPPAGDLLHFIEEALDSSINAIVFTDAAGFLTFVNRAFSRMWGYDRAADVGGRHLSSFVETQGGGGGEPPGGLRRGGWIGEGLATKADGHRFPVAVSLTRIDDPSGEPMGVMGSFIDMTERQKAEHTLHESEERYRSLVESTRDPIFRADAAGRFLYANEAAAAVLGRTREHVEGQTVDDLCPPRIAEGYRTGIRHVIATGETLITEDPSEADGRAVWFSTVIQPVRDAGGRIVAAQAIVRDITTWKRAEQALRRSEERLTQAIRVADLGTFDHDHTTGTVFWSPELRRMIGWGPDDPVPSPPSKGDADSVNDLIHPDDQERIWEAMARAHDPRSDGFFDVEYRLVRPDGGLRWVKVRSQTFFQGEGAVRQRVRTVGAVQDVTERNAAEAERARLQEQLTQAQKMDSIGRLAGGVAHDFNNMLSVITGHVELALGATGPDEAVRDDLEQIQAAAARATDLTRRLLGFARRQTVTPRVIDLNRAVAGSLAMLQRLIGEDVDLVWRPGVDLHHVRIDPGQVDQVLANLAANARDAIAGVGRLTIHTENVLFTAVECARHEEVGAGEYVLVEVTDTGRGMDPVSAAHLFEPFYTTKPVGQGTGLGLATVYGIVKQNDGCVEVQTEENRGTTVRVFLPGVAGDVTATEARMATNAAGSAAETVLVVEDESAVLRLSKLVLERLGYVVLTATTPGEAIELFEMRGSQVHLLVTDVVMPEMNGRELATRLRLKRPDLKTLYVSGYSASALAPKGMLESGVHFLQKPFTLEDLATSVREALAAPPPNT